MLHDLGDLRLQQRPASEWNSRKGPEKGIKFRGGAPPAPPAWHYSKDDLRAYDRWERKVRVWQLQVASYLPENEAAMALFVSLKGEAEDELETADLKRINSKDGVDFILDTLRSALKTRAIYQKRKYIHDFEHISRFHNESVRSFCNRYHRVERALQSCGVDIAPMYDSEARGARLLERLRLTTEQQRMILIGTNQALHFDAVKEAAQLQFPEHRPIPPVVFTREFDSNKAASFEKPENKGHPKGLGKNKGKDKGKGNKGYRTYVAEVTDEVAAEDFDNLDGIPEDGEEVQEDNEVLLADAEEEELLPDGDDGDDNDDIAQAIMEAAGVLTVTARRLQGVRLGRKFSGGKATIEERKKRSHCSACGQQGHWAGDAECSVSKSGGGKGAAKGAAKNAGKPGKPAGGGSKVMIVRAEGSSATMAAETEDPAPEQEYGSYFTTFVCAAFPVAHNVSEVLVTKPADFAGYAVLDTACQKNVCSGSWLHGQRELLRKHKMSIKTKSEKEGFQFGFGPVQFSSEHAYVPVALDHSMSTCCLFGTSVLHENCEIPLLLSLFMIARKLQAVLDFPKGCAYFGAFGIEVPIAKINGHLCIGIANFPGDRSPWNVLSRVLDQGEPDLDLVRQPLETTTTAPHGSNQATTFMADRVAPRGVLPLEGRAHPGEVHAADCEVGAEASLVDGPLRPDPPGHVHPDPGADHGTVLPSGNLAGPEREPTRKLFPVHSVRDSLAMGPRGLGRAAILAAAAASAALGNFLGTTTLGAAAGTGLRDPFFNQAGDYGEDPLRSWSQGHDPGHEDSSGWCGPRQAFGFDGQGESLSGTRSTLRRRPASAERGGDALDGAGRGRDREDAARGGVFRQAGRPHGRESLGFGPGKGRSSSANDGIRRGRLRLEPGAKSLKSGTKTWITSFLRQAQRIYEAEVDSYEALPVYKQVANDFRVDVLDVGVGPSRLADLCPRFGLSFVQPASPQATPSEDSDFVKKAVEKFKPLCVFLRFPTSTSTGSSQDSFVSECAQACLEQGAAGRLFLCEGAPGASLWHLDSVKQLAQAKDSKLFQCDAAALGAETADRMPVATRHQWLTNSVVLAETLNQRLAEHHLDYCDPGEPHDNHNLHDTVLLAVVKGIATEARRRFPSRFSEKNYQVLFARPSPDAEAWRTVLDDIEARFSNTHKKPFYLTTGNPVYQAVAQLVPWDLTKVQATWTPQARRLPQEFPYTHRGAAMRLTTGEFALEAEDLASVSFPKQRFVRAVRVAVFFYGMPKKPPETSEPTPLEQPPPPGGADDSAVDRPDRQHLPGRFMSRQPVPGLDTEVWFEGNVDKRLQASLARLHVNMGHPPKAELVRMLAAAGTLSGKILSALDNLRCGSCLRTRLPRQPPPASLPSNFNGFFGEVLQSDVVYLRVISGGNFPVLGITCEATSYHVAKVLDNKTPAHVLETVQEMWYRPLGLPLKFRCDPGGEFGGEVIQFHMRHGIIHDVIPAEAHHRLGKIERRNALLRSIVERLVDEKGVATKAELDQCLIAATFTMNSCTFSHGRSPYQAVFGRVPRPLGDLLSDPLSLVISPEQQVLRPEVLRADAMKALAEHSANSSIKRALLRKTHYQVDLQQLQPGQPVAFWRWSGRSRQHKKGAWSLARFISVDPDNKSVWVQVNTTTVRVAGNQIRTACGWEEWTPSREDVAMLKDAERNLRGDLWQDGREEPPGEAEAAQRHEVREPVPLPPLFDKDYWRYTNESAIRVHVEPRHDLFVPDTSVCEFDLNDLEDQRETRMTGLPEPLPVDDWRDPACSQTWEQPWTGTTTFKWRRSSQEAAQASGQTLPLPLRLPTALAQTATPTRRSGQTHVQQGQVQTNVQQEQVQTNVQQEQVQTNVQQEQVQTNVQQGVFNQYVDNRRVTMAIPTAPVPPTPRNRRGRSRTPSRQTRSVTRSPVGAGTQREALPPEQSTTTVPGEVVPPLTPGELPFSPGVPETPPFSAVAPGTPDYNFLPSEQQRELPELPPHSVPSQGNSHDNFHYEHRDAVALEGTTAAPEPGDFEANQFSSAAAASTSSQETAAAAPEQAPQALQPEEPQAVTLLPQKRPADALYTSGAYKFFFDDFGEGTLDQEHFGDYLPVPFKRDSFYGAYLTSAERKRELEKAGVTEETQRPDESSDDEALTASNNRTHSRQELKQLDREIPWREIMKLPRQAIEKYIDAVRAEEENWMRWGGVRPLTTDEARRVLQDKSLSRRILRSRAAYRDKNRGLGEIKAKRRVVLIGCQDPDLFSLTRDSPTPSRLSEALVLLVATAGANGEFNNEKARWSLWVSDAKSAFLQGERNTEERAGPLYMYPPRDDLMVETGAFSSELYEVMGNCFGLPDAPRVWYQKVHRRLSEKDFKQHGFDKCLYYHTDHAGRLRALLIVHVDDFLCTYHEDFDSEILRDMFVWGSVTIVEPDSPGTYRGKEINKVAKEDKFVFTVTQVAFIDGLTSGSVPRGRSKTDEKLTPSEWKEFRSLAGSIQWLASQTRPEVAAVVSLSNRGSETTVTDLKRLYETVDYLKETKDRGLCYQAIPVSPASMVITYADSSWANASLKSQYGLLVLLCPPQVTERPARATLLDWKSARSTRVCRSTLAAEASAADEGADRAAFANMCLSELLYNEPAFKVGCKLNGRHVTDAKSLYDCVVAENPNVSDKRSLVNVRSIQQTVSPKEMHWVPTRLMWADGLTKLDSSLLLRFSEWLRDPYVQLRDVSEPTKN